MFVVVVDVFVVVVVDVFVVVVVEVVVLDVVGGIRVIVRVFVLVGTQVKFNFLICNDGEEVP